MSDVPIIPSDIKNGDSLLKMAKRAKVVINCCGPYRFLGEPVVKACIEAGANYVDVSAEPQFLESIQLNYHKAAQEKGVYIVNACGFDCIPCDLGLIFIQDKFPGTLNSVVTYLDLWVEGKNIPGPLVNYGTWESVVYAIAHVYELSAIRKQLFPEKLPTFKPKVKPRIIPHRAEGGWAMPFFSADLGVMNRTQRYLYEHENKRPVQVDTQGIFKSFFLMLATAFGLFFALLLVDFKFGRDWLLNYPHIFSWGTFRKDQYPSEEKTEKTVFQITLYAEGWDQKLTNRNDQYSNPPNKSIVARVKGRNPAYGTTCACLVGSAITIATEKNKLPQKGGVYTPGIAFGKTSLIELLNKNEVSFDILYQKDI